MSLSGTRLGPYNLLAPLGAGGMGEVYRATDTRLKRHVAIKILPAALAGDPPDGKRLVYGAATRLYAINADGSGAPEPLTTGTVQIPSSWSAGANAIAFLQRPSPRPTHQSRHCASS
jgi:serine/threonine protein kinase